MRDYKIISFNVHIYHIISIYTNFKNTVFFFLFSFLVIFKRNKRLKIFEVYFSKEFVVLSREISNLDDVLSCCYSFIVKTRGQEP